MTRLRLPFRWLAAGLCALLLVAMAAGAADQRLSPRRSPRDGAPPYGSEQRYAPPLAAQDTVWCFCPPVLCSHGRMAGCSAGCYTPKKPLCRCEAQCDLYEKPIGSNRCSCE